MNYPKHPLLFCLLACLHIQLIAQFPTSPGTKWEYFQFFEDIPMPVAIRHAFSDSIVADTTIGTDIYHQVERKGRMYNGSLFGWQYDTIDATYYFRVAGSKVYAFESSTSSPAQERLIYDFGLSLGDTLWEIPIDLICLSPQSGYNSSSLKFYHPDTACFSFTNCDSFLVLDYYFGYPPYLPAGNIWNPFNNSIFENNVGTLKSEPHILVLDVFGQHYYLGKLSSNGSTIYEHPMLMVANDPALTEVGFELSPNPAQEILRVRCDRDFESLQIYDLAGREFSKMTFPFGTSNAEISIAQWPRGSYFVLLNGKDWKATQPLILN